MRARGAWRGNCRHSTRAAGPPVRRPRCPVRARRCGASGGAGGAVLRAVRPESANPAVADAAAVDLGQLAPVARLRGVPHLALAGVDADVVDAATGEEEHQVTLAAV